MNRELVTGLAQLSAEKGLPKEVVSDIIARAIKRAYGDEEHIDVKVDVQTGAFKVYLLKTVVEKVEVLEVRRTLRGPQIIVSRAHKALVKRLFELEVPEIFHGQVEIVGIAREPGSRTKIAVRARQPGLDARGACIGQRGLRVQAIVNELGGEKIDIIEWAESPERYVANALEPAHVVRVDIVPDEKTAYVIVPDRQLSLAIGKEGQNARPPAKLTGWRIDIRSESEVRAEVEPEPEPEPVAVAEPVAAEEESEIRHDLVAEGEAESAQADEEDLDEEDRARLGGKKKRAERR